MRDSSLPVRTNVLLAPFTTFRVGGLADFFGEPKTLAELPAMLRWAHTEGLAVTILGAGANVLVADAGVRGLVLRIRAEAISHQLSTINVEAGVSLGALSATALQKGLSGFEFLAGIPGSVGGAIYGNAGGWNQSIGDRVIEVIAVDRGDGAIKKYNRAECDFHYRTSRFKRSGEIVWAVTFELEVRDPKEIRDQMKLYAQKKNTTQPIQLPSAGCVFTNYEIKDDGERVRLQSLGISKEFIVRGNIPAGWLIEHAGLKGLRVGQVEVSPLHGSFLVNHGDATAADILALMELERKAVFEKFGIKLNSEIQKLGF